MSTQSSEWNEEVLGIRPTEETEGSFEGQQTFLAPCNCGCNQPTAYFANGKGMTRTNICWEQTMPLRAKAANMSIEEYEAISSGGLILKDVLDLLTTIFGDEPDDTLPPGWWTD